MWPFSSKSLRTRITELEQTVSALRTSQKGIEGEWETTYRKMHALRISLRRQLTPEPPEPETPSETVDDAPGRKNGNGKVLSHPPDNLSDHELLRRFFG